MDVNESITKRWTTEAKMCYERRCRCNGCINKSLETKCRMKYCVIALVKKLGVPKDAK